MSIAIYGGSFNPPHLGHYEAAHTVKEQLKPDKLLIIPDNIPPHKQLADGSPTAEERMELCRLAFSGIEGAQVSDMEIQREGKSYTADTLSQIMREYPGEEIILVIGTDMLLSFEQWYRFTFILDSATLAAVTRNDGDDEAVKSHAEYLREKYSARIVCLDHDPVPMSSMDIRSLLAHGAGSEYLDERVYSEIIRRGFYDARPELSWLREKMYDRHNTRRIAHVAGCENEAVRLANFWGADPESAATAAILHDMTKRLSADEQLILAAEYGIINDISDMDEPLYHAVTGAEQARREFGVSDEIYGAIRWHTTGRPDMTLLEKIVWLADYIEPTRDFPGVDKVRQLAYKDIDEAMITALNITVDHICEQGKKPHHDSVDALMWFMNRQG